MAANPGGHYTFGDSDLARERLELLADTFQPATEALLREHVPAAPRLAVDLGCGPGRTTALLQRTLRPRRTIAVDASDAYVIEAARLIADGGEVIRADVLDLPTVVADADVMLARFLLTHLAEPLTAVARWVACLSRSGVLLIEEVESITTTDPTLERYLRLQRRMLESNDNQLEIGPLLAGARSGGDWTQVSSESIAHPVAVSRAARLFAMNFATWRDRPSITDVHAPDELDELADALQRVDDHPAPGAAITWHLRDMVLGRPEAT